VSRFTFDTQVSRPPFEFDHVKHWIFGGKTFDSPTVYVETGGIPSYGASSFSPEVHL